MTYYNGCSLLVEHLQQGLNVVREQLTVELGSSTSLTATFLAFSSTAPVALSAQDGHCASSNDLVSIGSQVGPVG